MKKWICVIMCLFLCACSGIKEGDEIVNNAGISETNADILESWVITQEELSQTTPNWTYDYEHAKEKGLSDDGETFNETYFYVQAAYKYVFCQYLNHEVGLQSYDETMVNSALSFLPLASEAETFYQKNNPLELQFIYLRNNFYVEKLEQSDLETIKSALQSEADLTENLLALVQRTYSIVIKTSTAEDKEVSYEIIYEAGMLSVKTALNDALVIAISDAYAWDADGNLISAENERAKEAFVENLAQEMENALNDKLDVPVTIFLYKSGM